jgi:hypothetical protein
MTEESIDVNDIRFLCRLQHDYRNLHVWVRRRLPMPKLCEFCNMRPPQDLANITGKYTKDFLNWKYLCRKCHGQVDHSKDMTNRVCSDCGSSKTWSRPQHGWPCWNLDKITGGWLCNTCYCRRRYYKDREKNIYGKHEYYKQNKSRILADRAEHRYRNSDRIKAIMKEYRTTNRDRLILYYRNWRLRKRIFESI